VLTAACLLVRADAFRQVGGFDEGYWNGYEDVDLCFKLREQGWQLAYQPASVVIHHESKSGKERFAKVNHNIQRLHEKWLGKVRPDAVIDPQGGWHWIQDDQTWRSLTQTDQPATTLQPVVVAGEAGMLSIVILTFNQLWCTKECVESIQQYTPEPHEIVFVDNGSSDGTVDWLREQAAQHDNYRLIENGKNLGFAKGCNQGIEAAAGEYILLLNNDVVVTTKWLAGLLDCYHRKPHVGIVGPMTNNISGIQRVVDVGYSDVAGMHAFAQSFRERNRYRMVENRRIVGFCMLFSKQVAEEVGLLDETFGSGNFEDDDYCLRAELAGYRNYIAGDVFIHHYGSQTFAGNKMDYGQAMQNNMALYRQKWNYKQLDEAVLRRLIPLDAVVESRRLAQQGDIDKAIDLLMQQGIRVAPDNPVSYLELAELLIREGRFQDALEVLPEMPAAVDPALKQDLAAVCHCSLGDDHAAHQSAQQAGGRPRALVVLGTLGARQGNWGEAERLFRQAILLDPSLGNGWMALGMLLWGQGKHDEAFVALKRAVTVDPLNREAVQILRDMAERLDAGLAPCNTSIG
jgi:GT2 family glycosyltransferase